MSSTIRFSIGFAVLAVVLFGGLAYAFVRTFTGEHASDALVVIAAVLLLAKVLPRPLAWVTMLGYRGAR